MKSKRKYTVLIGLYYFLNTHDAPLSFVSCLYRKDADQLDKLNILDWYKQIECLKATGFQ